METIIASVGKLAKNNYKDVFLVQCLLNGCLHLLPGLKPLNQDGKSGLKTINAIENFQTNVLKMERPDGKIDPHGKTIQLLNQKYVDSKKNVADEKARSISKTSNILFPLKTRSPYFYKTGMRAFGSNRSHGRKHAGCDLYAPIGTPVYAMDDGEIINGPYAFYLGTYALEIKHTHFIARYGEIKSAAKNLTKGSKVKKGQLIGYVGELKGLNMSMLHLELYSGTQKGPLTIRDSKPYQRRSDLINPTEILDKAK